MGSALTPLDFINGKLSGPARDLLLASKEIGLLKPSGGVRPIAMPEIFFKLAGLFLLTIHREELAQTFLPIQYGVGVSGGSERAARAIQAHLETYGSNAIVVSFDMKNAFNERDRAKILEELFQHPEYQNMWPMIHWAYAADSELLIFFLQVLMTIIRSREGGQAG